MSGSVQDALDGVQAFVAAVERMDDLMGGCEWHRMPYCDFVRFVDRGEIELARAIRGFTDRCRSLGVDIAKDVLQ